ncbi:hypothetical protein [Algibacter sp.]|uniref:hypothetical protein n=1 Tax=Algibacter sp. TaxID=1872428 RepID=UPI003C7813F3
MMLQELVGNYSVIGRNQDAESSTYQGTVSLAIDDNDRIDANWLINGTQKQIGKGFFKDNILVINFNYKSDNKTFKGVVVYKCISKDVLEGFWSEKHGDPNFIGEERCFRTDKLKEVVN